MNDLNPLPLDLINDSYKPYIEYYLDKTGECWLWKRCVNQWGYGILTIQRKRILVHRLYYYLATGVDPYPNLILHHCDTRRCLNPAHMYLGDRTQNSIDRKIRNRTNMRGADNIHAKLDDDTVKEILFKHKQGFTNISLAKEYSVSDSTICMVVARRSWTHVTIE